MHKLIIFFEKWYISKESTINKKRIKKLSFERSGVFFSDFPCLLLHHLSTKSCGSINHWLGVNNEKWFLKLGHNKALVMRHNFVELDKDKEISWENRAEEHKRAGAVGISCISITMTQKDWLLWLTRVKSEFKSLE